jgi:hypothetical protein
MKKMVERSKPQKESFQKSKARQNALCVLRFFYDRREGINGEKPG